MEGRKDSWLGIISGVAAVLATIAAIDAIWRGGSWETFWIFLAIAAFARVKQVMQLPNTDKPPTASQGSTIVERNAAAQAATSRDKLADLGAFLERHPLNPTDIYDQALLPHPKDELLESILLELSRSEREDQQASLQAAASMLAFFQPGVGPHPLSQLGVDLKQLGHLSPADLAKAIASNPVAGRWEALNGQVEEDLRIIAAKAATALQLGKGRVVEQQLGFSADGKTQ
jgi:hypothetical protein